MRIVSQPARKIRAITPETAPAEEAVAFLLKNLGHSLRQAVDEAFRHSGIEMSFAHFLTLQALESEPGVAGAELARRGSVTAQTMNSILRRVERDGDIERRPHPATLRADSWFVTKAGQTRLARAKIVAGAVWRRMLEALTEREVLQLHGLVGRCIEGLEVQIEDLRSKPPGKSPMRRNHRRR